MTDHWSAPRVVRVEPLGVELELKDGETLIEAAWRYGYYWPTVCWGQADCGACCSSVVGGHEHLSSIGADEARTLRTRVPRSGPGRVVRLACRLQVSGPVVVDKRGVRREEAG